MSNKTLAMNDRLYQYLLDNSLRESRVLQQLRDETAALPSAQMQISPEQGQFMALLVSILGAKRTLEVGVYTGYSALVVAQALPDDGYILGCDISEEYTNIAKRFWRRAGVDQKVDLQLAPAADTLADRLQAGEAGTYDFAFIDADKVAYPDYYELCLKLLRPGGLIAVDNVLWSGSVINEHSQDEDTQAIRRFNQCVHQDTRVDISLVPIGDGLTLARKK